MAIALNRAASEDLQIDFAVRHYASSLGIYMQGALALDQPLARLALRIGDEIRLVRIGLPSPYEARGLVGGTHPAPGFRFFGDLASDLDKRLDLSLIAADFDSHERCIFEGSVLVPDEPRAEPVMPTARVGRPRGSRIAVVPHRQGVGGAQWWIEEVRSALTEACRGGEVVDAGPAALGLENYAEGGLRRFDSDAAYETCVDKGIVALQELRASVVVVNTVEGLPAVDAALRLGMRVVWVINESYGPGALWASAFGLDPPAGRATAALERCLQDVDAQVFSCDETARLFERFPPRRFRRVVPFARPTLLSADARAKARRQIREASGIRADDLVFVSVATIEERKNQIPLVSAFGAAFDGDPHVMLLLAGPADARYGRLLHDVVARADLDNVVRIVDEAVEAEGYLAASDVCVSASDIESRPVVLTQALQLGLPVVATTAMGVRDLVRHDRNGLLAGCGDYAELRDCLRRINADAKLRRSLSEGAESTESARADHWAEDVASTVVGLLDS